MKYLVYFSFLLTVCQANVEALRRHLSATTCRSCINGGTKWCKTSYYDSGSCCSISSFSGACSGDYSCSNGAKIESNGGFALCPSDPFNCGSYKINLYGTSLSEERNRNFISQNTVCVYEVNAYSSSIGKAVISVESKFFTSFEVYSQKAYDEYEYVGEVDSFSGTISAGISMTKNVYIVATPSSSISSYDLSVKGASSSTSAGAIAGIVIGSLCGFFICVGIFIAIALICRAQKRQRQPMNGIIGNQNAAAATYDNPNPHLANGPVIYQNPATQPQMFAMNPGMQQQQLPVAYLDPSQNIKTAIPHALDNSASNQSGIPMNQYTPTLPPISGATPSAPVQQE